MQFLLLAFLKTATEISCLTKNLNSAVDAENVGIEMSTPDQTSTFKPEHARSSTVISSTAAILSFFGWNVFRPGSPDPVEEHSAIDDSSKIHAVVPDVLRCKICDRKIGLWAFRQTPRSSKSGTSTTKALDVVLEHREFCPIRTPAGKSLEKEGHDAWWTDAAILQETPICQSYAVERLHQQDAGNEEPQGASAEGGPHASAPDDRNDLGSVVAVLKTFIG